MRACMDCGADISTREPDVRRCWSCVWHEITRTTASERLVAALKADWDANGRESEITLDWVLQHGMAIALTHPEYAVAVIADEWCGNGDDVGEVIASFAEGWPEKVPLGVRS